jgi:hypothetical protein
MEPRLELFASQPFIGFLCFEVRLSVSSFVFSAGLVPGFNQTDTQSCSKLFVMEEKSR